MSVSKKRQWTSSANLEDKWMKWEKLLKQVNMPSLEDDPRQTLTIAGLEKGQGTITGTTQTSSGLYCVQTGGHFRESP